MSLAVFNDRRDFKEMSHKVRENNLNHLIAFARNIITM